MPYNGAGNFVSLPPPQYPAIPGDVIRASYFNAVISDLIAGLTNAITRDGQSPPTSNLPMAGKKHTGVADATATDQYATYGQLLKQQYFISITDPAYNAVSGTDVTIPLQAAANACIAADIAGDAGGPYGGPILLIPVGNWTISADITMPRNVLCLGNIIGNFNLKFTQLKRCNISGLRAQKVLVDGMWFSTMSDCYIVTLTIKGGGTGFGTFWNRFENIEAAVTIDLSNWSVNQNRFNGRGTFQTIGSSGLLLDGHANSTSMWDSTGGSFTNSSTVAQYSVLRDVYYEAGADIVGPYHVEGFQGDALGPPQVPRRAHIFMSFDQIERNSADFLSAQTANILLGGEWDYLDTAGKPPCLTSSGGTSVVADSTEPFGMKYKYGGVFNAAFQNFQITVPPCRTGKFSLVLAYQSTADFAAVEVQRGGGGGTTSGGNSQVVIDAPNNWKILRLSGQASTTANTVVVLYALTGAGSKTMYIGGMRASWEKAVFNPSPPLILEQQGSLTQGYISTPPSVDMTVTFPRPFSVAPLVQLSMVTNGAQSANLNKMVIQSVSTTQFVVRVYYTTDFTGTLVWNARGQA